jgi:hypothetical protein
VCGHRALIEPSIAKRILTRLLTTWGVAAEGGGGEGGAVRRALVARLLSLTWGWGYGYGYGYG